MRSSTGNDIIYDMELTVAGKGKVTEMETPVNVILSLTDPALCGIQ